MEHGQIMKMLEMAREKKNFKEIARLQKVLMFQKPNFKYPAKKMRREIKSTMYY